MSRTDRLSRSIAILLGVAFAAAFLAAAPAGAADRTPALAPTPNTSIVFYRPPKGGKPGLVERGTLSNGVYARMGTFKTGKWTAIAVGRDSMALYERGSGRLLTGRFRNGAWKPVRTRTIAKGFSHVVASCDSILFFRRSNGTGLTAEFTSGDVRDLRKLTGPWFSQGQDYRLVAASCDTLHFLGDGPVGGLLADSGWLRFGRYEETVPDIFGDVSRTHLAANADSYLQLDVPNAGLATGSWGRLRGGFWQQTGASGGFGRWDIIAGAADTILFYVRTDGTANRVTLEDGSYSDKGPFATKLKRGWRIIAGGR